MTELVDLHCAVITASTARLNEKEINQYMTQLSGWRIYEQDGEPRLEKTFTFKDFNQAMAFTNQVANASDEENHHPALLTEWGRVTVTWWTHRIRGLHQNDFIMAAKSDQLYLKA
jgi:4a-hydroxytetrahydrobiopterin dehydratase